MRLGKKDGNIMAKPPKMMDLNEFKTSGLLQEINRKFLHVLGLALAVSVNDNGQVVAIIGVVDNRADEQGMVYSSIDNNHRLRAENVQNEFDRRAKIRQQALGFVIQPLGEQAQNGRQDLGDGAYEIVIE